MSTLAPADSERARRISEQILARAAPLRLTVATTAQERRAVFQLRYETLIEQGWARPESFPDGLERDAYDEDAVHLVAWSGEEIAGTLRLVLPAPPRRLPLEETYDLTIEPAGQVVDGGRLVIAARHRGDGAHKVLALLFAGLWREASARGFGHAAAASPRSAMALFRRVGLDVQILGPACLYWGEERYPVLISATEKAFASVRGLG